MSSDLVRVGELKPEQVELVKRTIAKGATDDELALFVYQCNRTRLDPIARQICCVPRFDGRTRQTIYQTQVTIDGARLIAQRSNRYLGQTAVEWCGPDNQWVEAWLKNEPPAAARVGVYLAGNPNPIYAVAAWAEFSQTYVKDNTTYLMPMWKKMPAHMLAKCAEALALRKAFPQELSGLYIEEEMGSSEMPPTQNTDTLPVAPTTVRSAPRIMASSRPTAASSEYADAVLVGTSQETAEPDSSSSLFHEVANEPDYPEESLYAPEPEKTATPSLSPEPQEKPYSPRATEPSEPLITKPQVNMVAMKCAELGLRDHAERMAYISHVMGRQVDSTNSLTKREGSKLIEALIKAYNEA